MRLDQWLWAVRVFKSRSLAAESIKAGRVTVNGQPCKAAHLVQNGEIVAVRVWRGLEEGERSLRVLGTPPSRVSAKLVPQYAEDAAVLSGDAV